MKSRYDLHLSAFQISQDTVKKLEELGFVRDEFANNTRCEASEYHGTYRGELRLPNETLWATACKVLLADSHFVGGLEEEECEAGFQKKVIGRGLGMPPTLPPIRLTTVPAGRHKACDLHIGVELSESTPEALEYLERLQTASFDRPTPDGIRRVFTITCETRDDGIRLFDFLFRRLSHVAGLVGKMKLEFTTRFLRQPDAAPVLPLTPLEAVAAWLAKTSE